jgi:hypothetical protein
MRRSVDKFGALETALFVTFVACTNAFVAINVGWAILTTSWATVLGRVVPAVSLAALASFLAFVLLEDYLGRRGRSDLLQL